jgi:Nucleotide modification associated domain 2
LKLYSYVVARDYGIAPNPFFGYCTLATCKPNIRKAARVGDWILGTGSKSRDREGHAVFAMRVTEAVSFDAYWNDERFLSKRPNLLGSKKQAFGDNIYHRKSPGSRWKQIDSHHSFEHGRQNLANIQNDTKVNRLLISTDFAYWGGSGPRIPSRFRSFRGFDICGKRGHKSEFPASMVDSFLLWLRSLDERGFCGSPLDWSRSR